MNTAEARRGFLLGMTLNELAFLLFFLLLIITTALIKEQSLELENKQQQLIQINKRLLITENELDQNFKRLQLIDVAFQPYSDYRNSATAEDLEQFFSKLVTAEQNNQLLRQADLQIKQLQTLLTELGLNNNPATGLEQLIQQNKSLRREQENILGQLAYLQKQSQGKSNGLDHPPCWASPVTGDIEYLYRITLLGDKLQIQPAWPAKRNAEVHAIPDAIELTGRTLSKDQFLRLAYPVFRWSLMHDCRHFIRIRDTSMTSKRQFKNNLLGIESYFYKYLER